MDSEMTAEPGVPVLYLGWSNDAADALARNGSDTTFVVSVADAAAATAHPGSGRVVVVPDPERADDVVAGLLRDAIDVREFDRVCTEHEEAIVPAAIIAAAHGRPSLPVRTAVAVRDKFVQKRLVRDAGLPVAGCSVVAGVEDLAAQPMPFVVKPLDGAGTQHTYAVRDAESLARAVRNITNAGQTGPWLVEEFMTGSELHIDGVVRDGTVLFLAVSRYLCNVIEIQSGGLTGSVLVDPDTDPGLYERATELTAAAVVALEHADGVFHLEAFEGDDGRLAFSECAGRIAGGLLWESVIVKFGIDLYDEWARAVLGLPSATSAAPRAGGGSFGWVHLNARPGRVESIPTADDLLALPGVVKAQVHLTPGDTVPDTSSASHIRVARVLISGEDEESVASELQTFASWFRDQVRVTGIHVTGIQSAGDHAA